MGTMEIFRHQKQRSMAALLASVCFLLVGCSSAYYQSVFLLKLDHLETDALNKIASEVEGRWGEKTNCKSTSDVTVRCNLYYKEVVTLSATLEASRPRIVIGAVGSPLFPLSKHSRNDGSYAPEGMEDVEKWVLSRFHSYQIVKAYRSHNDILFDLKTVE